MIEGGGLGVFRPEEVGPIDGAGAERRRRHRGRRRGRGGRASPSSTSSYFQGPLRRAGRAPTSAAARTSIPENRLRVYDVRRVIDDARRHRLGARAAARLRARHGHRARAHRGPAGRHRSPTTRRTSAARSTATAPTRPRASCSCATPSTCRSCSCATRPGIMVGPEVEKTALVRHAAACSSSARASRCRSSRSCCARATASARRRWRAAASRRRVFTRGVADRRVRRHGPRGRGEARLPQASSRRSTIPPSASALLRRDGRAHVRARQGASTSPSHFEIDDVIDPADSRRWITRALALGAAARAARRARSAPASTPGSGTEGSPAAVPPYRAVFNHRNARRGMAP